MSKRIRNLTMAAFYRERPCVVCKDTYQTVGDHIKTFGSGGECIHENMWSLCFDHHREKEDNGLRPFVEKYKLEGIMASKGWSLDEFSNKWMRLTGEGWETD